MTGGKYKLERWLKEMEEDDTTSSGWSRNFQRGGVNILEVDGYGVATIKQMFYVSCIAH